MMLAVPVMLVRRWRRRRRGETQPELPRTRAGGNVVSVGGSAHSGSIALATSGSRFERPRSTPSGARLAEETLEPLCRYVEFRRRLEFAAAELERRLSTLPRDRWRIEPYPLTGERRNTLMVLGVTGVFVISATYPPGSWDDVVAVNRLAGKIQMLLPGYVGRVEPAICHPFASLEPRVWYRADEDGTWVGAWLVGGDSLLPWLEHFGREHGLGSGDLERFAPKPTRRIRPTNPRDRPGFRPLRCRHADAKRVSPPRRGQSLQISSQRVRPPPPPIGGGARRSRTGELPFEHQPDRQRRAWVAQ
jgi:hypothetical protein